jgi:apolipoprotein D and lipocalin family protein
MLLFTLLYSLCAFAGSDPEVVREVNLDRYAGKWMEIAHSPNFFQNGCVRSMAEYQVLSADSVSVHNTCFKKDGSTSDIKGVATISDPREPAKLKVDFHLPFKGDYWITELDRDYQWAVVSSPRKSSNFILARKAPMNEKLLREILSTLEAKGFDTKSFIFDDYSK